MATIAKPAITVYKDGTAQLTGEQLEEHVVACVPIGMPIATVHAVASHLTERDLREKTQRSRQPCRCGEAKRIHILLS